MAKKLKNSPSIADQSVSDCRIILVSNRNLLKDNESTSASLGEEFSDDIQLVEVLQNKRYQQIIDIIKSGSKRKIKHQSKPKPLKSNLKSSKSSQIIESNPQNNDCDDVENSSIKERVISWYDNLQNSTYIKRVKNISSFHLDVIDGKKHVEYLSSIIEQQSHQNRPWVFWVHGNNQTLEASLKTCVKFQKLFPVNIVLFAWPSRSYNPRSLAHVLFSGVSMLHPTTRILSRATLIKAIYERYRQYRIARKLARNSVPQFVNAYRLLSEHLFTKLKNQGVICNLFVHSLGHYLLLSASQTKGFASTFQFDNAIFHQADIDENEGKGWLIKNSFARKHYITVNRNDYALYFSGLCNNKFNFDQARTRLGNGAVEACQFYEIIDFGDDKKVGWSHDIIWNQKISKSHLLALKSILGFADKPHSNN